MEIKQNASTKKEEESEQMLDMLQPEKYSPLEVKDGQLNVFGRDDIVKNVWFLPVIPDKVEIEVDSGRNMTDLEKLVAFRTSY